jgi:hypothetical protein
VTSRLGAGKIITIFYSVGPPSFGHSGSTFVHLWESTAHLLVDTEKKTGKKRIQVPKLENSVLFLYFFKGFLGR